MSFFTSKSEPQKPIYVKHAAFDWGNTLVYDPRYALFTKISKEISQKFKEKYNKYVSPEIITVEYLEIDKKSHFVGATHFGQEEEIVQALLGSLGMPISDSVLYASEILTSYRRMWESYVRTFPLNNEIKDTLTTLKERGISLSVFSNERKYTCNAALAWMGIRDLFNVVATSDELDKEKPDPEVLREFLKKCGYKPEESAYVGDDVYRDIFWAARGGMKTILYKPPGEFRMKYTVRTDLDHSDFVIEIAPEHFFYLNIEDVKPDLIISKFSDLKDFLFKL